VLLLSGAGNTCAKYIDLKNLEGPLPSMPGLVSAGMLNP